MLPTAPFQQCRLPLIDTASTTLFLVWSKWTLKSVQGVCFGSRPGVTLRSVPPANSYIPRACAFIYRPVCLSSQQHSPTSCLMVWLVFWTMCWCLKSLVLGLVARCIISYHSTTFPWAGFQNSIRYYCTYTRYDRHKKAHPGDTNFGLLHSKISSPGAIFVVWDVCGISCRPPTCAYDLRAGFSPGLKLSRKKNMIAGRGFVCRGFYLMRVGVLPCVVCGFIHSRSNGFGARCCMAWEKGETGLVEIFLPERVYITTGSRSTAVDPRNLVLALIAGFETNAF